MNSKSWFEVDKEGLKALQTGKPKHYILRELIANAFDENIKICTVFSNFVGEKADGTVFITVVDDSPEGFKNLWVGISITKFEDRWRIPILFNKGPGKIFVSLEPLLDEMVPGEIYLTDWVIIGCLTGCKNPYRPPNWTIENMINECKRMGKPLFIKDNVGWPEKIQEYG